VDWQKALEVAPKGWSYRDAVQGHVRNRGAVVVLDEANQLRGSKKYREAIEKFKTVVESHSKTQYAIDAAYGIAGGYALLGEKKNALDWLEKAVETGWEDLDHLEKDSDLESLRSEVRYKKLTENLKVKKAGKD